MFILLAKLWGIGRNIFLRFILNIRKSYVDAIGPNRGAGIDEEMGGTLDLVLLLNENFILMNSIPQLNTEVSLYMAMVFTSWSAQRPRRKHRNTMTSRTLGRLLNIGYHKVSCNIYVVAACSEVCKIDSFCPQVIIL